MRLLAFLLCVQTVAPAIAQEGPATAAAPAAKEDPNKKICKRQQVTGSYFMTRECHTKAEWDLMAENARSALMRQRSGFKDRETN